jgi:cytochrome c-type biogenesis protein
MDGFSLSVAFAAFFGGVFMFLAPCTLPLVPAFLASLVPGRKKESTTYTRDLTLRTIFFSAGFTTIFVLFGLLTGFFGSSLTHYKLLVSQIGGVLIIIFGLSLFNLVRIPIIYKGISRIGHIALDSERMTTPIILGALFALGWTPCAGPILASILFLGSQTGSLLSGGLLLFIFSLGLAVPFIIVGLLFAHTVPTLVWYERYIGLIRGASGTFLVLIGFVLLFGDSIGMTTWGFALYSYFGYVPMCAYL